MLSVGGLLVILAGIGSVVAVVATGMSIDWDWAAMIESRGYGRRRPDYRASFAVTFILGLGLSAVLVWLGTFSIASGRKLRDLPPRDDPRHSA